MIFRTIIAGVAQFADNKVEIRCALPDARLMWTQFFFLLTT